MPITAPAHQALVLPVKLRWPSRTDATAMCVAAAAPDLGYPLFGVDSHSPVGVVVWAVPFTLVVCWALRRRAAAGVFANLPDAGPFRLHSYRAITARRPPLRVTLVCALVGAASHVVVDAFTHAERWGSQLLGLDGVLFTVPWRGEITGARTLQYLGHTVGSLVAVLLFLHIGRSRLMERWYGDDVVAGARVVRLSLADRAVFWVVLAAVTVVVAAPLVAAGAQAPFALLLAGTVAACAAGSVPRCGGRR